MLCSDAARAQPRLIFAMNRHRSMYFESGAAKAEMSETPGPTKIPRYLATRSILAGFHRGQVAVIRFLMYSMSGRAQSGMSCTFFH